MGLGSLISKFRSRNTPPLERVEELLAQGEKAQAAALLRELAQKGNGQAQFRLGQLYERGEGVLQNFIEASKWFREAGEQAYVPAMARLGEIYLTGLAAPKTASPGALSRLEEGGG